MFGQDTLFHRLHFHVHQLLTPLFPPSPTPQASAARERERGQKRNLGQDVLLLLSLRLPLTATPVPTLSCTAGIYGTRALVDQYAAQVVSTIEANKKDDHRVSTFQRFLTEHWSRKVLAVYIEGGCCFSVYVEEGGLVGKVGVRMMMLAVYIEGKCVGKGADILGLGRKKDDHRVSTFKRVLTERWSHKGLIH